MRFLPATILAAVTSLAAPAAAQEKQAAPPVADQAKEKHMNHLADESSPYLLSHKHNPVEWYPWGPEALAKAEKTGKPIFLSIGYSACHWCHVMERESFEDEEIAAVMNKHFICIKVDREERPDLDEIYMAAVMRISGSGGWPMSVWLTPAGKPFWGGTYFPPEDKFGRPGFKRVCETLGKAWAEQREQIEKDADSMATYLAQSLSPPSRPGRLSMEFFAVAAADSMARWDEVHGGFGPAPAHAPKFPHASEISALLTNHARHGDDASLRCAEQTLQKMARGGIYDQVGGGFHRYSTDRMWLVPHFEKMLYDNALLAQTYLDAFQHTGNPFYRRVATETLDYLLREMQDGKGGFHSATDADSEGVEGRFFVWTKAEIDKLLAADAELFAAVYGVTEQGNWHEIPGATVLSKVMTEPAAATKFGISEAVVRERLAAARKVLYDARRSERVPPLKDDKVLAAWNGMVITAMARGYLALGEVRYLHAAQAAAKFVLTEMRQANGRLYRSWRGGKPKLEAYLDDYAYVADGLTLLFQCDFDPQWLAGARALLGVVETQFRDPEDGNFYFTANDHEELVARSKSVQEGSIPSGAALAIRAFVRAGLLLVDQKLVDIGQRALEANHGYLQRYPNHVVTMLSGCDLLLNDPREVVVAGAIEHPGTQAFLARLRARWPVAHVVTVLHPGNAKALTALVPSHEHKGPRDGEPAAYVCKFGVCEAPVTDPDELVLK